MSVEKQKGTRWVYILAFILPVLACVGTGSFVYRNIPKLPGALEGLGIQDLTQVVVPGSAEVYFPKAGGYAVYYEYRSVVDGVSYIREKYPPNVDCRLTSKVSGENISITPDYVEGNIYATNDQERAGVLINSIVIRTPGVYIFSCKYSDGRMQPKIVLAVGPNIVWEFFNIAVKPVAAVICGGFVFIGSLGVSILIIGLVMLKRHRSKNRLVS